MSCPTFVPMLLPAGRAMLAACCSCFSGWETVHICHGHILAHRWERSTTSSQCSSVKTQFNKPALRLQDHIQFPLTAELTPPKEFPSWLFAHSPLCLHNNNKPGQWTKYNPARMKLHVVTEAIWQPFGTITFLPSFSTHLAVYTNSGLQQALTPVNLSHQQKNYTG